MTRLKPALKSARGAGNVGTMIVMVAAAIGVIQFSHPTPAPTQPFSRLAAGATMNAFGTSQAVRMNFALPGHDVEFPLEVGGDPSQLTYEWVQSRDTTGAAVEPARPVTGSAFTAPGRPGFYRLAIVRGTERHIIGEPMVAVMVPFKQRVGGMLNGYQIGTYLADRLTYHDHPDGFLEVDSTDTDLRVSKHLRLGDFLTHDSQEEVWPKYVALNPRLLDKLELVFATIGARARVSQAGEPESTLAVDVHSGFRTPAHNARVLRAASDSRHQYGDAADVAIDANGDGRVTIADETLIARAVDQVENDHPDLVGGLGLYTSGRYRTPYVHIDTRGTRSRWKG